MSERNAHEEAGHVSCAEAREIASRFNASHWRGKAGLKEFARYSIPANPQRDDDIRLGAFIDRAERMERDLEALEKLRAHPGLADVLSTAEDFAANWRSLAEDNDPPDEEPCRETCLARAAYDLLAALLKGGRDV